MSGAVRDHIQNLSQSFERTSIICIRWHQDSVSDFHKPVNDPDINIFANDLWDDIEIDMLKTVSIVKDISNLPQGDDIVSYIHYPSFYSFFLSPFILKRSEFSVGYFGKEAEHAAVGHSENFSPVKKKLYEKFQNWTLGNLDLCLTRDPRIKDMDSTCRVEVSHPITNFEPREIHDLNTEITDPIRLLYVGRLRRWKGVKYLLRSVADLRANERDFQLNIVGGGQAESELRRLSDHLDIDQHVNFNGYVYNNEELKQMYAKSDIFVLPSLSEGFPRVINEAMASGLPVVTTNVGGISRVLSHRVDAMLVDPHSADELSSAISEVASNNKLRSTIVQNSYEKGQASFDIDPCHQHLSLIHKGIDR